MASASDDILLRERWGSGTAETTPEVVKGIFLSAIIGTIIAICTTLPRLLIQRTRLWYDDLFAFLGLVSLVVGFTVGKFYHDYCAAPMEGCVAMWYIGVVMFDTTIWLSRLSILFSIIRLGTYQRRLYAAAACFSLILVLLVSQLFWMCEMQNRHTNWKADVSPHCILGKSVGIAQITTDVLADIVLVTVPLLLIRYLQSAEGKALKARLTVVFVVGGLTTLVSAVHMAYLISDKREGIVASTVELSVSVIITNFTVLAAFGHRLWNKYHPVRLIATMASVKFASRLPEQTNTSMTVSAVETWTGSGPAMGSREDESSRSHDGTRIENRGDKAVVEVFELEEGRRVPLAQN